MLARASPGVLAFLDSPAALARDATVLSRTVRTADTPAREHLREPRDCARSPHRRFHHPVPALNADLVLEVLEAAAVIASAIAGMIIAADKRMDLIGAFALACVNAFGGGTVRDLLLDNRPFYWIANWGYLLAILAICIPFVYSVKMFRLASAVHKRSLKMDAVGLALFSITGAGIALTNDAPLIVAILMGVIAGTTGGVLRDVVVNELPDLFAPAASTRARRSAAWPYSSFALRQDVPYAYAATLGTLVIVVLRMVSVRLGIGFPEPQWNAQRPPT